MKTGIFILTTLIVFACNNKSKTNGTPVDMINNPSTANNPTAEPSEYPVMTFEKMEHNFGDIMEGASVETTFKFKNTGKEPIILSSVQASCGCTTPSWSKEPILPGKSSKVTATYNTQGRPGNFVKTITINSNIGTKVVKIQGVVEKAPESSAPANSNSMMKH